MTHPLNGQYIDYEYPEWACRQYDHILEDLKERLNNAAQVIHTFHVDTADPRERARLRGKREGVRLALSYLEEYL